MLNFDNKILFINIDLETDFGEFTFFTFLFYKIKNN
jgi:hypothetical protein